jgi:hypothetical protein
LPLQVLQDLKAATVFIKVNAGGLSGSGSGFLIQVQGDTGYIITNHHVANPEVDMLRAIPTFRRGHRDVDLQIVKVKLKNVSLTVVFHSGTRQEQALPAEVLATDPFRDLAVLRVRGLEVWPRPIVLEQKTPLIETMPVYILGFPFGQILSLTKGNPAITINKGSVSSVREDEFGNKKLVQIDGAINPGNSGGPVVDEQGRLVGIAVATIKGAGIGLAITTDELLRLFQGRVGGVVIQSRPLADDLVQLRFEAQLIDPLNKIRSVALLYRLVDIVPPMLPQKPDGSFDPLSQTQRLDLHLEEQQAVGELTVRRTPETPVLIFQTTYVNGEGKTRYTQRSVYSLRQTPGVAQPPPIPNLPGVPPPAPGVPGVPPGELPGTPPVVMGKMEIRQTNAPLADLGGKVGDLTYQPLRVNALQMPRCLCWASDGKSFYCLEQTGILRRVAVDGLKETLQAQLGIPANWLTLSHEGLLVASAAVQQVWVLDPQTLQVKRKISVPRVQVVASAPSLSVAFATSKEDFADELLSVLDLRSGRIVQQYRSRLPNNRVLLGYKFPTVTPDGKYLFTLGGLEALHRFRIKGQLLIYEQSSPRIAQNGQAIEVSPDSKLVCLPSGGGNYGANLYSTFIYAVNNLAAPVVVIESGPYPRALGFAPKQKRIYAQNATHQLILFTYKGIKEKEYALPGADEVRQILPHPAGDKVLLLTRSRLYWIEWSAAKEGE